MVIVLRRLEVSAHAKAEKRCRTATPWPIALCSAPLVGFHHRAVMTTSEDLGPRTNVSDTCRTPSARRFSLLLQEEPLFVPANPIRVGC